MAEPPNALTLLLDEPRTPSSVFGTLASHRCLSPSGVQRPERVIAAIESAIEDFDRVPRQTGPTLEFLIVSALSSDGFLNAHAAARARALRVSNGLPARLRAKAEELWWRLRY
jgi:hypothetical protein